MLHSSIHAFFSASGPKLVHSLVTRTRRWVFSLFLVGGGAERTERQLSSCLAFASFCISSINESKTP